MGDITVNLAQGRLVVFADPVLDRMILNLTDNVLRYGWYIARITPYVNQNTLWDQGPPGRRGSDTNFDERVDILEGGQG